jgi:glycosyltransferase involved in cell wall biosynthesis
VKILTYCPLPFALAHGGAQTQMEQTTAGLRAIGVEVEPLGWWDGRQTGDIIHCLGRMPSEYIHFAHQKGIKVVLAELLTAQSSRSRGQLRVQKIISRVVERLAPPHFVAAFNWQSYRLADACVALTSWEAWLMTYLFQAPAGRVHVVPNGVEEIFFRPPPGARGKWLVCTATITGRKRILELARAAILAQTPVWIIGKAYAEADDYARQFLVLARQHPEIIRYDGPVPDREQLARIYREARGFVLLSNMESLSLSALEAAACACPLLLSDLPWARSTFGDRASYCPVMSPQNTAAILRRFYNEAPALKTPPKPETWIQVAHRFKKIYETVLGGAKWS